MTSSFPNYFNKKKNIFLKFVLFIKKSVHEKGVSDWGRWSDRDGISL